MKCKHCKKTIWMWQYNAMIISQPYKSGFVPFNLKPGEYHKDCSIKATELFHKHADQYIKEHGYYFHCSVNGIYPVHKIVNNPDTLRLAQEVVDMKPDERSIDEWASSLSKQISVSND